MFRKTFITFLIALVVLSALFCFSPSVWATGGLTGALDEIGRGSTDHGEDSSQGASSSSPSSPSYGTEPGGPSGDVNTPMAPAVTPSAPDQGAPGETTVDPLTGVSTTVKTNPDGSKTVTKKDKDGHLLSEEFFPPGADKPEVVKEYDPQTGHTTTTVTNKDGSKSVAVTNADGFLVDEEEVRPPRPSGTMVDTESGTVTTAVTHDDGSRTITTKDQDGNVISTQTVEPPGKGGTTATVYDPNTGRTVTSTRNPDGSRTVTQKDRDGNLIEQHQEPPPGKGEPFVSTTDPKTGVTTTIRGPKDDRTVSDSRTWKDKDGVEHTLVTDNHGNQTEAVKDKDGNTVTTHWDNENNKTETRENKDGSKTVISDTEDGYIEEKTTKKDGSVDTVKKDHAGNVLSHSNIDKDGNMTGTDDRGITTEEKRDKDGSYTIERTDAKGNKLIDHYDEDDNLIYQTEDRQTPKEPGQAYFENEMGGRFGEWDKLPQSVKDQYAQSEDQILERTRQQLLRDQQAREQLLQEEERKKEAVRVQKEADEKFAAIQKEKDAADKRYEEFLKKQELWQKRRDAEAKMADYNSKIQDALARGDTQAAQALSQEADEFHGSVLVPLAQPTDEEQKQMDARQTVRDRIGQLVTSRARNVADNELQVTEGLQDAKEAVTDKAKWVSIGAEMQEQTKKTTRMADREKAFAEAKQAEIMRLLNDPKTTPAEKEVLYNMLDMSQMQTSAANELLFDNARLTAIGYGVDAALLVSGGELAAIGKKGVVTAAEKLLAKEAAKTVVVKTTETGLVKLAGQGAMKAATTTIEKVAGENAALAVEKTLTADVGKAAGNAVESGATKVIGQKGVETVKSAAAKAADMAMTDVTDIPGKLKGSASGGTEGAIGALGEPKTPPAYGDATMPIEVLEDYAKNPRVETRDIPNVVDQFPTKPNMRTMADDFVQARSQWKKMDPPDRQVFDQRVRSAIDEAAAMGDKWAKRVQQDLNEGKFTYQYDPGLKYKGVAAGDGTVVLNPMKGSGTSGRVLDSPDSVASTLVHEYAHSWKGPEKWATQEGRTVAGSATKGEYNEVRAFLAEANFNKRLKTARDLNGKAFDDTTYNEINTLMKTDKMPAGTSYAKGAAAKQNLQGGLVDDYYSNFTDDPELALERLSSYKGGSMADIRERLRNARGTPDYDKILKEIQAQGGRTTRKSR